MIDQFEINKCDGWGRLGMFRSEQSFVTPNILELRLYHQTNHSLNQSDPFYYDSPLKKSKYNLQPKLIVYPSLQMQGKITDDISDMKDLFPEESFDTNCSSTSFHMIPWELTTVYLNHYEKYIEFLNGLDEVDFNESHNFMLNLPFTLEILKKKFPSLKSSLVRAISLGDITSLLTHPNFLIKYLSYVKSWVSPNMLIYAPGVPLTYIPILTYLGVDLFDLLFMRMVSTSPTRYSEMIFEHHVNSESFFQILQVTRKGLEISKLRDLVRFYSNSFPPLKSLLRIIDKRIQLDVGTPIYGPRTLYCTDETDFTRPEVARFRERIRTRYNPPPGLSGMIFLPCSAKKPYSRSKSHLIFEKTIRRTLKKIRNQFERIILTSPLGVVPRNLEYTFPAAHYDIPTTGDWSGLEKENLTEDIIDLLQKIDPSTPLVGYVKGVEREILAKVCQKENRQIHLIPEEVQSLFSNAALKQFTTILNEAFSDVEATPGIISTLNFLRTIADYQFGTNIGSLLIPNDVKIHGRKEFGLRVFLENEYLLSFRPENGFLTLSLMAGNRLLGYTNNVVTFDGLQIVGSTIFTKAISEADPEIRPNDEVLIINEEGSLIATGISYLSGDLLVNMNRGKGVRIRKKVK
jgi:archaeosine synthase